MKHVIVLLDGMADYPVEQLNSKTPLEYASTPNMDMMFKKGVGGTVKNIPEGMPVGSAVANLSVLGYAPDVYFTGRSPIEAASMGVTLKDTDLSARCNLVTLSDELNYEDKTMVDYCSDEISTQDARVLIDYLNCSMGFNDICIYPGISYRHLLVWPKGPLNMTLTPPHDILGEKIKDYLPENQKALEIMKKSSELLKKHPLNKERVKSGLRPANSIWLWGAGTKTALPSFNKKYNKKGAVISAVDLIQGIGVCADMDIINIDGATGNFNTNYKGKASGCINALRDGYDFVYVHIEAPDECGHRNEAFKKAKSIEYIDKLIIQPVIKELENYDKFAIMSLADHPTPLSLMTHTSEPVPFAIYKKGDNNNKKHKFTEANAAKTDLNFDKGPDLTDFFIN